MRRFSIDNIGWRTLKLIRMLIWYVATTLWSAAAFQSCPTRQIKIMYRLQYNCYFKTIQGSHAFIQDFRVFVFLCFIRRLVHYWLFPNISTTPHHIQSIPFFAQDCCHHHCFVGSFFRATRKKRTKKKLTASTLVFVVVHGFNGPLDLQLWFARHRRCQGFWVFQYFLHDFHEYLFDAQTSLGGSL